MASRVLCGAVVAAATLVFTTGASLARGTEAQREACTPDAFRLCGQFIPDEDRIEACLRAAGPRLSPACYVVFYPDNAVAHSPPRPGMRRSLPPAPPPPSAPPHDDDDWD